MFDILIKKLNTGCIEIMFKKIRTRAILASIFENAGLSIAHPVCNYIYKDGVTIWFDSLVLEAKSEGVDASAEEIAKAIIKNVLFGYSKEKIERAMQENDGIWIPADCEDENLLKDLKDMGLGEIRDLLFGASVTY